MPYKLMIVALQLALLISPGVSAQESGHGKHDRVANELRDPALGLSDIVETALNRSPRQVELEAMNDAARALYARAGTLLRQQPMLLLSGRSDQWQTDAGYTEYEVGVEMPLWRSGERKAGKQLAEATAERIATEWNAVRLDMSGIVRELVWEYALAENAVSVAEDSLEAARRTESDIEKRVELGESSRQELLLTRQETLARQDELNKAQAELFHIWQRYKSITGLDRLPNRWREERTASTELSPRHPRLMVVESEVTQARREVEITRLSKGEPVVLGVTGYRTRPGQGENLNDSVRLSIGIPFGGKDYLDAGLNQAHRVLGEAEAKLLQRRRDLQQELTEAEHELHHYQEAIEIAREARQVAEEQLRMSKTSFELGESGLILLLRAQNQSNLARRQFRENNIKLQRAIARYNQAAGVPL